MGHKREVGAPLVDLLSKDFEVRNGLDGGMHTQLLEISKLVL